MAHMGFLRDRHSKTAGLIMVLLLIFGASLVLQPSDEEVYVRQALPELEAGIHADSPQWEEAREAALSDLDDLENMDVAYSLLDRLARIAGGRHSSFTPPEVAQKSLSAARNDADFPLPSVEVIEGDIGLVRLPGFFSDDPESWRRYTDEGIGQIAATFPAARCGWVLDLRSNQGGSIYSILGAVAPLIDDGQVLSFVYPDGHEVALELEGARITAPDGSMWSDSTMQFPNKESPRIPRIAVLQDEGTVSAAEAIIVALEGQRDVRTFGRETRGFTSLNNIVYMDDGGVLGITVAYNQDRLGQVYDGPIPPDEETATRADDVAAATAWLDRDCRDDHG